MKPSEHSITVTMPYPPELQAVIPWLFDYPSSCPICEISDPAATWIAKEGVLHCGRCDGALLFTQPQEER